MQNEQVEVFEQHAPEILADLAKHIETELMAKVAANDPDWNINKAKQISVEVAHKIAKSWGGEVIYIPRNLILLISERDRKIYREFNGNNQRELARKYNVSMQWIYAIVKRIQMEEFNRRQIAMFPDEN